MELQALLKRLRRSSAGAATLPPSPQRPPDEGSAAIGFQLGSAFASALLDCVSSSHGLNHTNTLRKVGCDIIDALSEAPSTSFAFGFSLGIHKRLCDEKPPTSQSAALEIIVPWWLTWIEQSHPVIRSALIRGYVHLTNLLVHESMVLAKDSDLNIAPTEQLCHLADAYSKLARDVDRRFLVRESVAVSFSALRQKVKENDGIFPGATVIANLSGLVAKCMLLPTDARAIDGAESFNRDGALFWTVLLRECRFFASSVTQSPGQHRTNAIATILTWLARSFHQYALRLSWNDDNVVDEAFGMFQLLCDLLCDVSSVMRRLTDESRNCLFPAIQESYNIVMGAILCRFSTSITVRIAPCIFQLSVAMCSTSRTQDESPKNLWKVSDVRVRVRVSAIFRLALMALNSPDMSESKKILESIYLILKAGCFEECCGRLVLIGSIRALGRIFASVKSHASVAAKLCWIADEIEEEEEEEGCEEGYDSNLMAKDHVVLFFQTLKSSSGELNCNSVLSKLIVPVISESTSSPEQMGVFLVVSSLLCTKTCRNDPAKKFDLLQQIVERWPHLGARSIPLATSFIQTEATQEPGCDVGVIPALHFLCSASSIDPSCAQQVWSILSTLTEHPSVVRIASIRMFTFLCKANRKLYGRVRDCLGRYCSSPDVKMRIAATATLCDLAREDLIRDVSDVIGWLQGCLDDDEAIVVYYVLMTLHHFIHGEELDFDVVIKVISKKLVKIGDVGSILQLSPIVIESFVVLLGDGAQSISDDSEEVGEISPQVEAAVTTLLALAQAYKEKNSQSALRIVDLIYSSLSGYKIGELGADADSFRSLLTCEEDPSEPDIGMFAKYSDLTIVVMDGLKRRTPDDVYVASATENRENREKLATTLLQFEEDTLGPLLWKKQRASTKSLPSTTMKKQKLSKSVLGALPSAHLLQSLYEDSPSTGTAIARMFCLDDKSTPTASTDEIIDVLAEVLADLNIAEIVDPVVMALYYGSWLEAGETIWASISASCTDSNFTADAAIMVIKKLDDLKEVDHDNSLIAISAICCIMPETYQGVDLTIVADKVYDTILRAYNGHEFTDSSSARVAFGLLGCHYARSMVIDRVGQILGILDESKTESKSLSSLMSLALIVRSLSSALVTIGKPDVATSGALGMMGRILSLLIDEFHLNLSASVPPILNLVASLKTRKASPDLLDTLQEIDESAFSLTDTSHLQMKGVFIVLSIALPALSSFDFIFLKAIAIVLAKCSWSIGKGYALASVYKTLAKQNMLKLEDMKTTHAAAVKDSSVSALFAACTIAHLMFDNHDQKHEVLSMIRLDDNGISSDDILNACLSVGTVPLISDWNGPQLHLETTKPVLMATIEMLTEKASDPQVGRGCRDMSAIVLGIFCCMKNTRQSAINLETQSSKKVNELPRPRPFTLLDKVVGCLREGLVESSEKLSEKDSIPECLRCIGKISLPTPFAILVKSILKADEGKFAVKDACLDMIVSQIESERHSGSSRSEFISLSLQIAKSPPAEFWSLFQSNGTAAEMKGMGRFMKATSSFITKWPSGVVETTIENLWSICAFDMIHQGSFENAESFLNSLCVALQRYNDTSFDRKSSDKKSSRSVLSPVVLKSIYSLLTLPILTSMVNFVPGVGRSKNMGGNVSFGVWSSYLACLEQIPASTLNDANFFVISTNQGGGFDHAIARILIIAHLAKCKAQHFGSQTDRHLMKAQLWIARQRVTSLTEEQLNSIRVAMLHLGGAGGAREGGVTSNHTHTMSQESRKELILQCFEIMLLNGLDTLTLECLSIQCGSWCSRLTTCSSAIEAHEAASSMSRVLVRGDLGLAMATNELSGIEVSDIIGFFVRDLPWRLASICRELGGTVTGLVANRLLRILQGVGTNVDELQETYDLYSDVLVALKGSATCCSEIDANGLAYAAFLSDETMLGVSRSCK